MKRRWAVSLTWMLLTANIVFGQAPEILPAPTSAPSVSVADGPVSSVFLSDPGSVSSGVFSAEVEYLLWFIKGSRPSFSVSSTAGKSDQELGDAVRGQGPSSGGRLTLGYWHVDHNPFIPERGIKDLGAEARFLFVGSRSVDRIEDTSPTLTRPFFDLNNRVESSMLVASPGVATGGIDAHATLSVWGAEANVWKTIFYDQPGTTYAVRLLGGFRYLNANSELEINSISAFNRTLPAGSPFAGFAGNRLLVQDSFAMHNHFYGGQVGIGGKSWFMDTLSLEGSLRVALGGTNQNATTAGRQVRTLANGTSSVSTGGLYALPSNSGTRRNFEFTQVPEGEFRMLCPVGSQWTFSAGFTALYWNRVLRAVEQIDRNIDITQIPNFPGAAGATSTGLGRPTVPFRQSDLWLLGISVGVEFRW